MEQKTVVNNENIEYGNPDYGVWYCVRCRCSIYPLDLIEDQTMLPVRCCSCGNCMEYDEIESRQKDE